jgi:hypothetical protein
VNLNRLARLALAVVVAGQLALLWHVRALPTQDGPLHVYNAALLELLSEPSGLTGKPALAATFEPRPTLDNRVPQLIIGAAERSFGARAEALFVSAYVILLALAARWAITGVRPEHGPLGVFVALLALNYLFHMGFYPFCAGLPPALATIGAWVRTSHRRAASLALQAVALIVADVFHPFAFAFAGLVCGCVTVVRAMTRGGTVTERARALAAELAILAATALPAAILLGRFVGREGESLAYLIPGPGRVLDQLTTEPDWVAFSSLEWVPLLLGLGVPVVMTAAAAVGRWRDRAIDRADAFAIAAVVLGAAFLLLPDSISGGGFVHARLSLTMAIAAALWVATVPRSAVERDRLAIAGAAAALALVAVHVPAYRAFDDLLAEHAGAVAVVPAHASLLALSTADTGSGPDPHGVVRRPRPFLHAAGRVGVARDIALLENYQAARSHFPIQFRPEATFYFQDHLSMFPYGLRKALVPQGPLPDYVMIWGPVDPARFPGVDMPGILTQLLSGYELIYESPRGLARIWRRTRH